MKKTIFLLLISLFVSSYSYAQITRTPTSETKGTCADGTYTTSSGSGTCSGHGGLRR